MQFGVLGPLSVRVDGRPAEVTAGRDRTVLAMLLLGRGRVLSEGVLIEALWDASPPVTARTQLQSCVLRLRRLLGAERVVRDPVGYGIRLDGGVLDAVEFDRLLAEARVKREPDGFREALALWRGDALVGIASPLVRQGAAVLDECRAAAIEDWIDAEFGAGNERMLIGELTGLVERFPLRERLREQLMTALYRSGRQAEALSEYRRARRLLVDELGIEPGADLQVLHERILTGQAAPPFADRQVTEVPGEQQHNEPGPDPQRRTAQIPDGAATPTAAPTPPSAGQAITSKPGIGIAAASRPLLAGVPAQRQPGPSGSVASKAAPELVVGLGPVLAARCLPRTPADFTGRAVLVDGLLAAISATGPGAAAVMVIDGMAGSGKSALALHVAQLVGDRYPDAHLFIDLHGHSDEQPVTASAALMVLLRQLGYVPEAIPAEWTARIGLWRTELASRRVLVVFDNAASSAQLAELLPTSSGSLALVTSRRRLAGLDAVTPLSLPVLDREDALAMLARIAGNRVHLEPDAADAVVARCGGLPLAIRLAGARLAHRSRWRVADLLRRLGETPLPELAAEDRTVTAAFALSYRQLTPAEQSTFRLLGIYPGATFDALAVAALTGRPLDETEELLDHLIDVHLLEEPDRGVFRLHDLLREYAAALAQDLPADQRRAALVGVLDEHLHAAAAAGRTAEMGRADTWYSRQAALRPDLLAALTEPGARLERERPHLAAFVETAAAVEPRYAWLIPHAAWWYLWRHSYNDDVIFLQQHALDVAERCGDRSAAATAANYLASAHYRLGRLDEARALLQHCITLRRKLGERNALTSALINLATLDKSSGRFEDAIRTSREAARVPRNSYSHYLLIANQTDSNIGLGRYVEGLASARRQLMVALDNRDPIGIAGSLQNLAITKCFTSIGNIDNSLRLLRAAQRLHRQANHLGGVGEAHHDAAKLLRWHGNHPGAIAEHQVALDTADTVNDPLLHTRIASAYAITLHQHGEPERARAMAERALRVAEQLRVPYRIARAQASLAECIAATDPAQARWLWQQALRTFTRLGAIEQADVEKHLTEMTGDPSIGA